MLGSLTISQVGVPNQTFLRRGTEDVPSAARERLITYVDFADFEATKTKVEASQR